MTNPVLDLLALATGPDTTAIIDTQGALTRGALLPLIEERTQQILQAVPANRRLGLRDTRDRWSIVNLLVAFAAERSIVMLPTDEETGLLRAAGASCCELILAGDHFIERSWELNDDPHRDPRLGVETVGSNEALVLFTSGTTSEPRGVRISARNLAVNLTAMLRLTRPWTTSDRFGMVLALTHSFGLSMVLMSLARQCPIVILEGGLPSRAVTEAADVHRVSILGCVPYYLRLVGRRGLSLGSSFAPHLRTLFLAGGGVGDDERAKVLADFHGETYLMYGFTEATARVALRRDGDGAPPNSVGLPLPGTSVEIVTDDGVPTPVGQIGVIRVSSPSLMLGYLGEEPRLAGSPWTTTDLGFVDHAGNLFITGRKAEMLNFRGNRVSAVAVEATVASIAGVKDARLVPDGRDEDSQCALHIIANDHADHRQLRREILRVVSPRGLVRELTFVDHLDFTRSGKPLRRA